MAARNVLRLLVEALLDSGSDINKLDLDGGTLKILPVADDSGAINIGDGTNDVDVKIFLGSASEYVEFNVGDSQLNVVAPLSVTGALSGQRKVTNLTSNTTLTVANGANGIITNRGADGAVVVTLPDDATAGDWFQYHGVADQNITFASETADTLVAGLDDAAADSLAFSTNNEKIGASAVGVFDGTQWHVQAIVGTATVVTA